MLALLLSLLLPPPLPLLPFTTGTVFNTPEAVLVRSSRGVGGMSRALHRLYLDRLLPRNWSDEQPPVLLNSWEAKYFHVNHDNIVEMARQVYICIYICGVSIVLCFLCHAVLNYSLYSLYD